METLWTAKSPQEASRTNWVVVVWLLMYEIKMEYSSATERMVVCYVHVGVRLKQV
jgi:hypothetical protein